MRASVDTIICLRKHPRAGSTENSEETPDFSQAIVDHSLIYVEPLQKIWRSGFWVGRSRSNFGGTHEKLEEQLKHPEEPGFQLEERPSAAAEAFVTCEERLPAVEEQPARPKERFSPAKERFKKWEERRLAREAEASVREERTVNGQRRLRHRETARPGAEKRGISLPHPPHNSDCRAVVMRKSDFRRAENDLQPDFQVIFDSNLKSDAGFFRAKDAKAAKEKSPSIAA